MNPGSTGIVGLTGIAQTAIAPEGTVFVRGELWRARSQMKVSRGENVRVTGVEGLMLDVESEKDEGVVCKKASSGDD
jgi:membrane-bound serine protease (ClpP class)